MNLIRMDASFVARLAAWLERQNGVTAIELRMERDGPELETLVCHAWLPAGGMRTRRIPEMRQRVGICTCEADCRCGVALA